MKMTIGKTPMRRKRVVFQGSGMGFITRRQRKLKNWGGKDTTPQVNITWQRKRFATDNAGRRLIAGDCAARLWDKGRLISDPNARDFGKKRS